jgi:hypothetical protein
MSKTKPAKLPKPKRYDPTTVTTTLIWEAGKAARKHDRPFYVTSSGGYWVITPDQPDPNWSHWQVMPTGRVHAHIGGVIEQINEYKYEYAGQAYD